MILSHPFKVGHNSYSVDLQVNLAQVRSYHSLAEGQAKALELEGKEVTVFEDRFYFEFDIEDKVELHNWDKQIKLFSRNKIDQVHVNNLLYVAKQMQTLEKNFLQENIAALKAMLVDIDNVLTMHTAIENDQFTELRLSFLSKDKQLNQLNVKGNLPKAFLTSILTPYLTSIKSDWGSTIKQVLGSEKTFDDLSFDDLRSIESKVGPYVGFDHTKAYRSHLHNILFAYIRENEIYPIKLQENKEVYPNNSEARLIYIILCLTGQQLILSSGSNNGTRRALKANDYPDYNDQIIKQVQKVYKDMPKLATQPIPLTFKATDFHVNLRDFRTNLESDLA